MEHGGTAGKAVDGNANSAWSAGTCTHTKYEWKPWWEVDMGKVYYISAVKVTNRGDCCGEQCNICSPMDVLVDETICHGAVEFIHGETKDISCPFVGDAVRVALKAEDYLMICEVAVKATKQSLLETAAAQCESHAAFALPIAAPNATEGHCMAGEPTPIQVGNMSDVPVGFQELVVGQATTPDGDLQATAEECQEHLLKSDELVEGAVWQASPVPDMSLVPSVGTCRLLMGRQITGAKPVAGAKCFRKLRCPQDMSEYRKKAGIGLHNGQRWG